MERKFFNRCLIGRGRGKKCDESIYFLFNPTKMFTPKWGNAFTRTKRSHRLRLVRVKVFSENISFSGNAILRKGKCIQVFGCVGICFTENQFQCLVRTNILRKMTSVLRKIISGVCFRQTFYEK